MNRIIIIIIRVAAVGTPFGLILFFYLFSRADQEIQHYQNDKAQTEINQHTGRDVSYSESLHSNSYNENLNYFDDKDLILQFRNRTVEGSGFYEAVKLITRGKEKSYLDFTLDEVGTIKMAVSYLNCLCCDVCHKIKPSEMDDNTFYQQHKYPCVVIPVKSYLSTHTEVVIK